LKVSQDEKIERTPWGIHRVKVQRNRDQLLVAELGVIGWGGNGGFQALNLAVQFGARRIILVGYDMRLDKGLHWHGRHPAGLNNPTDKNVARWRRAVDDAAPALRALGIEVINTSMESALGNYPKMSLGEALTGDDDDGRRPVQHRERRGRGEGARWRVGARHAPPQDGRGRGDLA
jgi:hypothetical protein